MRRVVITGLGLVTPLASGVEESWSRILDGQSGAGPITRFDASDVTTKYACEVPQGDGSDGTFNADDWMEPKERRKVDDFILYGIAAAEQADIGKPPLVTDQSQADIDPVPVQSRGQARLVGGTEAIEKAAPVQLRRIEAKAGEITCKAHPAHGRIAGEGDCAGRPGTGLEVGSRHDRGSVERMA